MSSQIFQAPATSYCLLDNVSVFLDRRSDKYHYLDREKTKILNSLRSDCPPHETLNGVGTPAMHKTVEELASMDLLTTKENGGTELQPISHDSPRASVYDDYWKSRIHPMTIARLVSKYHSLQRRLKQESLLETTQKAELLKSSINTKTSDISDDDLEKRARRLIDSRYFVYTYKDKCLFDSCLFFEHFVKQKIPVHWVFGVNLYPFAAHCWVEYKGFVLNDSLERVAAFTPIYVI